MTIKINDDVSNKIKSLFFDLFNNQYGQDNDNKDTVNIKYKESAIKISDNFTYVLAIGYLFITFNDFKIQFNVYNDYRVVAALYEYITTNKPDDNLITEFQDKVSNILKEGNKSNES